MRLRQLKSIIEINLDKLNYISERDKGNSGVFNIRGYLPIVQAVETFNQYKLFTAITTKIQSFDEIYNSTLLTIRVNAERAIEFDHLIKQLKASCVSFLEALDNALPKQDENSISVKLPNYNNLADLSEFVQKFNTILQQSLTNKYIDSKIELQNFDNGTLWIEIFLGGTLAVTFFSSLAWAAAVVRKKIFEGDILLQKAKGLKLKNESIEDIIAANKKQLELLTEAETINLINQIPEAKDDHEYLARLKNSIKMLAELIDKGTEIHPALEAPEEVKNLLPDFNKLNSIESKIKLLDNK